MSPRPLDDAPVLVVDTSDPTPPYEQLRRQLEQAVLSGAVPPGHRLPPIRQLARDLGLAAGTVSRAYRELELAGLVTGARGGGTRVRDAVTAVTAQQLRAALDRSAADLVRQARLVGADDQEVLDAVARALRGERGG